MEKMPTPTPQPEEMPLTPQTPKMEDLSDMPSYEEHMSSMRQELTHIDSPNPTKKQHNHEHMPSQSPAFLKARETALKHGQEAVGDEKREYPLNIAEQVRNGREINDILKNSTQTGVWTHIDEFIENGASIEDIHDKLGKGVMWLAMDKLVKYGDDVNKIADKIDDTAVYLKAKELAEYGADLGRLRDRLSSDEYYAELIKSGKLLADSEDSQ